MSNKTMKLFIPLDLTRQPPWWKAENSWGVWIDGARVFFPFSLITDEEMNATDFTCWMPVWWVEKNGLEVFKDTRHEPSLFG